MLPRDDDRRTAVCCALIFGAPCLVAAAQVATMALVDKFVLIPAVASAVRPLGFFNAVLAGCLAALGTIKLPGGKSVFTLVSAACAFVVGCATYGVAFVVLSILAEVFL